MTSIHQRWQAVINRTPGDFLFAVRTTGVFCRPGCRSRLPRRENVRFFETPAQARNAGFRPCKRCQPEADTAGAIALACRKLAGTNPPKVAALAKSAGMKLAAFRAAFAQATGTTPRGFLAAHRANQTRRALREQNTVTTAMLNAGYQSGSRFYDDTKSSLGMQPGRYRAGGRGMQIWAATAPCALGIVLVASTEIGICAIELGDSAAQLQCALKQRFHAAQITQSPKFDQHLRTVVALLARPAQAHKLPLDIQGTAFQWQVWQALTKIPPGQTRTYEQVATEMGKPKATRAVASAIAANPIAVAIPCHRVVGKDGKLHGYAWGLERKQRLLDNEK